MLADRIIAAIKKIRKIIDTDSSYLKNTCMCRLLLQFVGTGQPAFFTHDLIWLTANHSHLPMCSMSEISNCMLWSLTIKAQKSVVGSQENQRKIFMYMFQFSISTKITCIMSFYLGLVLISQFGWFRPRARVILNGQGHFRIAQIKTSS